MCAACLQAWPAQGGDSSRPAPSRAATQLTNCGRRTRAHARTHAPSATADALALYLAASPGRPPRRAGPPSHVPARRRRPGRAPAAPRAERATAGETHGGGAPAAGPFITLEFLSCRGPSVDNQMSRKRKVEENEEEEESDEDEELDGEPVTTADVIQDPKWLLRIPNELGEQVSLTQFKGKLNTDRLVSVEKISIGVVGVSWSN